MSANLKPAVAVGAACDTVVGALLIGQRGVAVLAAGPTEAATLTHTVMASTLLRTCHFLRFTPSAGRRLTLADVAFQAGIDSLHGEDGAAAMLATLKAHQPASGRTVLIVEAAEALDAGALEFFERAIIPSSQPLLMQLVLVGRTGFSDLLQQQRFPHLWEMAAAALPVSSAVPESPPAWGTRAASVANAFPAPSRASRVRPWLVTALGLAVLVGGATWVATSWLAPVPPSQQSLPAQADPIPTPEPPPVVAPAPQQPVTDEARERLRQKFDAFLERAGRNSAVLTPRQRQALFEEYLISRGPGDR